MALINRMARLFRADVNAVLDRIEEPETLLKQSIRDMEDDLAGDEQRCRLLAQEQGLILARRAELEQSLQQIENELDLCFEAGKEDLAKAQVKRRLEIQRHAKLLERQGGDLEARLAALKTRLEQNRARLDAMRQKAELLARQPHSVNECGTPELAVREEEVELAWLREQRKRSQP